MRVASSFIITIISTSADHCRSSNHKKLSLVSKKSIKIILVTTASHEITQNPETLILKFGDLHENPTNRILAFHREWSSSTTLWDDSNQKFRSVTAEELKFLYESVQEHFPDVESVS